MDNICEILGINKEEDNTDTNISSLDFCELLQYKFKLPIEYNDVHSLSPTLKEDIEFNDISNNILKNIYSNIGDKKNSNLLLDKWCTLYTTDKKFLTDNQKFVHKFERVKGLSSDFVDTYHKYRREEDFVGKYQYIDFEQFKHLNYNAIFLQCLGMYNIASPVITLFSPIIGLILPYFVFLFKGIRISLSNYIVMVKKIIISNQFINGILNFHRNSFQQNGYLLFTIVLYVFSTYQNIRFFKFYCKSIDYLQDFVQKYYDYLDDGGKLIDNFINYTQNYKSFNGFHQTLMLYKMKVDKCKKGTKMLYAINKKFFKYSNIGELLKINYELFYDEDYNDCFHYLTYLNQYQEDVCKLKCLVVDKLLNPCSFVSNKHKRNSRHNRESKEEDDTNKTHKSNKKDKTEILGSFYLNHIHDSFVKNDIVFDKNMIITGPNASGKTTLIKSSLINLFMSQSIGFGCYDSCRTKIYDEFHSYLNIPDTSNRDSLFQAEARRCKDIWNEINTNEIKNHFCIFDEIYSGTNPRDAVSCARVYLNALNTRKDTVDYVLTTHYIGLCEEMEENEYAVNKRMKAKKENDHIEYYYKIEDGICKINGGVQILIDMEYPKEILDMINK